MVILSLAVSTSSRLGLLIVMSRNRLGPRLALGVFPRIEYNRNRRFNFVGKGYHWTAVGIVKLIVIRIALLVPSTDDPKALGSVMWPLPSSRTGTLLEVVLEPCPRRFVGGKML